MRSCPSINILVLLFVTSCFLFLQAGPLFSQAQDKETEAKKIFKEGVDYYKKKQYALALESFKKSYELRPHWALHYNLGLCYKNLGIYVEAKKELEAYLSKGKNIIPLKKKKTIIEEISAIDMMIAELTLVVNVDGAAIIINGEKAGISPLDSSIPLNQGSHKIEVKKEGYEPVVKKLVIERSEARVVKIELKKIQGYVPLKEDIEPVEKIKPAAKKKMMPYWVYYGGMALGAAFIVSGTVTGALTLKKSSDYNKVIDDYNGLENRTNEDLDEAKRKLADLKDEGMLLGNFTIAFLSIGAAVEAAALVLYIIDKKRERKNISIIPKFVPRRHGAEAGLTLTF